MRVRAREFLRIGAPVRGGPIKIAADGDGRHSYHGTFEQPGFEVPETRLSFREAKPPAVIADDDVDVTGTVAQ